MCLAFATVDFEWRPGFGGMETAPVRAREEVTRILCQKLPIKKPLDHVSRVPSNQIQVLLFTYLFVTRNVMHNVFCV